MLYSSLLILEGCFERPNQKEIGVLSLVVLCRWASLWSWTVGNPACSRRMEPTISRASHYFCGNVWQDPASSDTMQYGIPKLWYLVYKLLTWFRVGWVMTDFAGYRCGYNNMFRFVYMLLFRCSNGVKKNCERNVNVCHAEFRSFCSRSVLIEVPNSISLVYFRWLLQILPLACPSVDADVFYFLGFFHGEIRIPFTTTDNF